MGGKVGAVKKLGGRKKEEGEKLAAGISGERRRSRWQTKRVKWSGPVERSGGAGGRLRQVGKRRSSLIFTAGLFDREQRKTACWLFGSWLKIGGGGRIASVKKSGQLKKRVGEK